MPRWMRRLRGVAGTALWWGASFGLLGLASAAFRFTGTDSLPVLALTTQIMQGWAIWGLQGGLVYGVAFATTERRRTWAQLSLGRAAWLGAAAGVLAPAVTGVALLLTGRLSPDQFIATLGVGLVGGALTAAGALAVARRADRLESTRTDIPVLAAASESSIPMPHQADAARVRAP